MAECSKWGCAGNVNPSSLCPLACCCRFVPSWVQRSGSRSFAVRRGQHRDSKRRNQFCLSSQLLFPLPMRNWGDRGKKGRQSQIDSTGKGREKVSTSLQKNQCHAEGGRGVQGQDVEDEMKEAVGRAVNANWGLIDQWKCEWKGALTVIRSHLLCITSDLHV